MSEQELLSIGELAQATGISADTIRVWERRYGKPVPRRLPSGHRRYTQDHLHWLRRVAEALRRGHRAGKIVRASDDELDGIVAPARQDPIKSAEVTAMVSMVRSYDAVTLSGLLRNAWRNLGVRRFLDDRVAPLLELVGQEWRDGTLNVRHEHFVSDVLQDQLRSYRLTYPIPRGAPTIVLATLANEEHILGLQMAALVCAFTGIRTRILGARTPIAEMIGAVQETGAAALGISISLANAGVDTDRELAALRRAVPRSVALVVGGMGARGVRRGPRGVEYVTDLRQFERWLGRFAPPSTRARA
ncbi:MAG: MerR family transcriptional regulator [Planctomycetota bacterium]|nr:MerR family transcriptional regulator [Planctomycetota bacterium]